MYMHDFCDNIIHAVTTRYDARRRYEAKHSNVKQDLLIRISSRLPNMRKATDPKKQTIKKF